jgi:hypothetical protein
VRARGRRARSRAPRRALRPLQALVGAPGVARRGASDGAARPLSGTSGARGACRDRGTRYPARAESRAARRRYGRGRREIAERIAWPQSVAPICAISPAACTAVVTTANGSGPWRCADASVAYPAGGTAEAVAGPSAAAAVRAFAALVVRDRDSPARFARDAPVAGFAAVRAAELRAAEPRACEAEPPEDGAPALDPADAVPPARFARDRAGFAEARVFARPAAPLADARVFARPGESLAEARAFARAGVSLAAAAGGASGGVVPAPAPEAFGPSPGVVRAAACVVRSRLALRRAGRVRGRLVRTSRSVPLASLSLGGMARLCPKPSGPPATEPRHRRAGAVSAALPVATVAGIAALTPHRIDAIS